VPEPAVPQITSRHATSVQAQRAALRAALAPLDWRLLAWLLHYPFQRADDLVVGMARWASRATVYRHLQTVVQHELVESVLPRTPGTGKRVYHLSNLGLHLLAASLETAPRSLARDWQTDEAGLLRLLPRLPTLLSLQDIVNGLVTHAADVMTTRGRRPTLVRWNWRRDLTHRFRFRERAVRLVVDGAVALCIEAQQTDGQTGGRLSRHWYGLLLLTTGLEDERLMRLRLERLLCWRESPERWSQYQHMLPVLILAHSPRQGDHWQRAMEQSAQKWRLAPLTGAIACVPAGESQPRNPWLLNWRTLATDTCCHLQDVLQPVPESALPPVLRAGEEEAEAGDGRISWKTGPSGSSTSLPVRLSRIIVGNLTGRTEAFTGNGQDQQETLAWLVLRLTPCQWRILSLLLAHPLLSSEELAVFLHLQLQSVRAVLSVLHGLHYIASMPTVAGQRWRVSARALQLLAAANRVPLRTLAMMPDAPTEAEAAGVVQHGVSWLLQHIEHTAGVYGFFVQLAGAATQQFAQALCWWETGTLCERRYRVNEQWYNLRPDALAAYRVGQQHIHFWLEWDRGTMNVRDLAVKFASYGHYVLSREWAREHTVLPRLVCVAPDMAQERRMMRVAQAKLAQVPGLVLFLTTASLLAEYSPLAAIWVRMIPQQRQSEGARRQRLFNERTDGSEEVRQPAQT
jgi:Replication-relaxation